jgi:hypothetical protein
MTPVGPGTTAMRRVGGLLTRPPFKALYVAGAVLAGYLAAHAAPPAPVLIEVSPETLDARGGRAPRGMAVGAPPAGQTATVAAQVPCTSPAPDPSSTCLNGFWQAPATAGSVAGSGAARFDRANGCVTVQPANNMVCRNGLWTMIGAETPVGGLQTSSIQNSPETTTQSPSINALPMSSTTNVSPAMATGSSANPAATGSVATGTCSGSAPAVLPSQSVACVSGAWVVR